MTDHPITPPPELVHQWAEARLGKITAASEAQLHIATQAARWGADQELEACCEWVVNTRAYDMSPGALRAARRPTPPSLKAQALNAARIELLPDGKNAALIIRALEALPDV